MKILIINSFYYPNMIGGAEHSVKNLAETLMKRGHEVNILCIGEEDSESYIEGVKVYRIKNVNIKSAIEYMESNTSKLSKLMYRALDLYGHANSKKIQDIINKVKPDIAHVNNFPGFGLNLFKQLSQNNIPIVFTARDYYSVCMNAKLINSKGDICNSTSKLCDIYRNINKSMIKYVDYITAPSNFTISLLRNTIGIDSSKSKCIYNSIDLDLNKLDDLFNNKKNIIKDKYGLDIVFLGRLDSYKGIGLLIENILNLNDEFVNLHIAGEGPLQQDILNLSEKYSNIHYYGKLDKQDLELLLYKSDILAAPSKWNEPFGRIVLDAYKHCMPVLSTGNGGLGELIINDETGYILDFEDKDEFKKVLFKYKDKELLTHQMLNCKNEVLKYSNEYIVNQYEEIYNKLIKV